MIFRNQTDHELSFVIASVRYDVPVSGTVEIPDVVAYAVKLHGLPLAEVVAQTEETEDGSARIGSFNFDPPKSRKKN